MKIAHVTSTFPPYEGGMGNVCYQQAKHLAALGHDVTVFVPKNKSVYKLKPADKFKICYLPSLLTIGNASIMPSLLKKLRGFDIVHLHYPFFGGDFFVKMASVKYNIPYVLTYHLDIESKNIFKKIVFRVYNFIFQDSVMHFSKKIFGLSWGHINYSQISKFKDIKKYITVIPNGVNLEDFDPHTVGENIIKKLNIPSKCPIIIFIGALDKAHYFKRLDLLIHAIKQLEGSVYLLVIGDGNLRKTFENLVLSLDISNKVSFIGKVPNEKINTYILQSDFLVLPSENESFGIVLIEAMACKKAVIATDLPSIRSYITDGVNGLLFKKGSLLELVKKIKILLSDIDYSKKIAEAGFLVVKNRFTWTHIAKLLEEQYSSILKEKISSQNISLEKI